MLVKALRDSTKTCGLRAEGQELIISGPSSVDTEHFRKNHLPNLAKQLESLWFSAFHLSGGV